jgi:hypothetical protein
MIAKFACTGLLFTALASAAMGAPTATIICPSAQLLVEPAGASVTEHKMPTVIMRGNTVTMIASRNADGQDWRKIKLGPLTGWVLATCLE